MSTFTFETHQPIPRDVEGLQKRITILSTIKDELDRELVRLMGKNGEIAERKPYHCVRCEHRWVSRLPHRPHMCPKCKAIRFDSPPAWTYAERAKKAKPVPVPLSEYAKAEAAPLPHSVLTRSLPPEDDINSVTLSPPPAIPAVSMSLREKLALLQAAAPHKPEPPPAQPIAIEPAEEQTVDEELEAT